jgi:hypothetical protein
VRARTSTPAQEPSERVEAYPGKCVWDTGPTGRGRGTDGSAEAAGPGRVAKYGGQNGDLVAIGDFRCVLVAKPAVNDAEKPVAHPEYRPAISSSDLPSGRDRTRVLKYAVRPATDWKRGHTRCEKRNSLRFVGKTCAK